MALRVECARNRARGGDGQVGAIDHCVGDVVGWHVAKVGDRWAALEPIR